MLFFVFIFSDTFFFLNIAAPGQPPQSVEWNLIGSQLMLQWDPVIALETESEVTGYIVSDIFLSACRLESPFQTCFPFSYEMAPFLLRLLNANTKSSNTFADKNESFSNRDMALTFLKIISWCVFIDKSTTYAISCLVPPLC